MKRMKAIIIGCLVASGIILTPAANASTQQKSHDAKMLTPSVARKLTNAYAEIKKKRYKSALHDLNQLLNDQGQSMKPFDRASVLQIRGSAYVNLDRNKQAIDDFQHALKLGALPAKQNRQLRYNIAQLNFQTENFDAAVHYLKQWLKEVKQPKANAYYMLAAAQYYRERYKAALPPAERALRMASKPRKNYFSLANIIYSKLNVRRKRARLLKRMIGHWPSDRSYWKQLAALYKDMGDGKKSLAVLETAYRSGLVDDANDIHALAQMYSVHGNPSRGAQLIEKEMESGAIRRNVDNLKLLSQLWSQAREHDKAIPVLKQAAKLSDNGKLYYRLGQELLADKNNAAAEHALEAALHKGGLSREKRANAWLLLGNARFNQAGSDDKGQRVQADKAFAHAEKFSATRGRAKQWRHYISAINNTEQRQNALEAKQNRKLKKSAQQRLLTYCRAQRLAGSKTTAKCRKVLAAAEADNDQNVSADSKNNNGGKAKK